MLYCYLNCIPFKLFYSLYFYVCNVTSKIRLLLVGLSALIIKKVVSLKKQKFAHNLLQYLFLTDCRD